MRIATDNDGFFEASSFVALMPQAGEASLAPARKAGPMFEWSFKAHDNPMTSGNQHTGDALKAFVLDTLLVSHKELRAAGIVLTAIFGSVARGEAIADSDVDILVELDPLAKIGLFKYVGLRQTLEAIVGRNVDLCTWNGLRHHARDSIVRDAVDVIWPPAMNRNGICESC